MSSKLLKLVIRNGVGPKILPVAAPWADQPETVSRAYTIDGQDHSRKQHAKPKSFVAGSAG
ncbi:hypothetical protein, partial [Stenotrophomonas sp. YIM B06876]|uniref:hypothetical protein n=1 Tax=Stenotrophomonas sp. YIM B06876 TaxID=3060211 RepID=UPI002738CD7B